MSAQAILDSIEIVAGFLPFALDDYDRVNAEWGAAMREGAEEARRTVDVWTYCYVSRYFALKFVRSGQPTLSDVDRLIERALRKIRLGATRLRSPGRYTSWVNTICRNAYLNYVRSYRLEWLDDPENVVAESGPAEPYDVGLLAETLSKVIDELPQFLRDTARLRFIRGLTYREISAQTGQTVPTSRSYANKSLKLIRDHPRVRRILAELGRDR